MAKKLGVSRTPRREAVVRLSADRLATISPNHGAHVAPLDALGLTQYFESLELTHRALQHWACLRRTAQDIDAIASACQRYEKGAKTLDPVELSETNQAFHHAIAAAAKNELFAEYEMKLSILGMRIGWIWYRDVAGEDLKRRRRQNGCRAQADPAGHRRPPGRARRSAGPATHRGFPGSRLRQPEPFARRHDRHSGRSARQ